MTRVKQLPGRPERWNAISVLALTVGGPLGDSFLSSHWFVNLGCCQLFGSHRGIFGSELAVNAYQ